MGITLGSILSGLTTAAGGAEQGIANRRDLERQARQELLAQQLVQAQIQNYQSEVGRRTAQTQADLAKPHAPVLGTPAYNTAVKDAAAARAAGAAGVKQKVTLTPNEQRAARQAVRALKEMRDLYRKDQSAAQTPVAAAALQGMGRIPVVGSMVSGLTGPAAQQQLSPSQQAFQRAGTTFRHHYAMVSPHARTTLGLLHDINTGIVPPAGTDPATIAQSFAPTWDDIIAQLEPVAGSEATVPSPPTVPTAPTGRYNKKFWHP